MEAKLAAFQNALEQDLHVHRIVLDDVILDQAQIADLQARLGGHVTAALIERVIAEGDAAQADQLWAAGLDGAQQLHALAGTAGTFGARRLQSGLALLQAARVLGDEEGVARVVDALPQMWHSTRTALDTAMQKLLKDQPIARGADVAPPVIKSAAAN